MQCAPLSCNRGCFTSSGCLLALSLTRSPSLSLSLLLCCCGIRARSAYQQRRQLRQSCPKLFTCISDSRSGMKRSVVPRSRSWSRSRSANMLELVSSHLALPCLFVLIKAHTLTVCLFNCTIEKRSKLIFCAALFALTRRAENINSRRDQRQCQLWRSEEEAEAEAGTQAGGAVSVAGPSQHEIQFR